MAKIKAEDYASHQLRLRYHPKQMNMKRAVKTMAITEEAGLVNEDAREKAQRILRGQTMSPNQSMDSKMTDLALIQEDTKARRRYDKMKREKQIIEGGPQNYWSDRPEDTKQRPLSPQIAKSMEHPTLSPKLKA